MITFPKKLSVPYTNLSGAPTRPINQLAEIFRDMHGFSYGDLATEMEYGFTADKLRRHIIRDSDDAFTLSRIGEVFHWITRPSEKFLTGVIHDELRTRKDALELTNKRVALLWWPDLQTKEIDRAEDQVEKFFQLRSLDAWKIARCEETFWPYERRHTPSWLFLKENGPLLHLPKRPKQLHFELNLKKAA